MVILITALAYIFFCGFQDITEKQLGSSGELDSDGKTSGNLSTIHGNVESIKLLADDDSDEDSVEDATDEDISFGIKDGAISNGGLNYSKAEDESEESAGEEGKNISITKLWTVLVHVHTFM